MFVGVVYVVFILFGAPSPWGLLVFISVLQTLFCVPPSLWELCFEYVRPSILSQVCLTLFSVLCFFLPCFHLDIFS